jgi:D-lactate dehydrogenase
MKVAVYSTQSYDKESLSRSNTRYDLVFFEMALDQDTVELAKGCDVICAFVNDSLNATVLGKMSSMGINMVAMRCAGYNNVDLQAAAKLNIHVARVPAYSPHAVAEHAVAMVLTLNRKTHKAYNRVREGNFSLDRLTGFDLYGKTVGVIGTGKIGEVFCEIMLGFGCKVLAFDLVANKHLEAKGVEFVPLINLLPESHIVSLHCPLNEQTRHLINSQTVGIMRKGSMLINTSRGGLIDTKAVIDALKSERLGYLGIDVYEEEEKFFFFNLSEHIIHDDVLMRLMSFPNVLITAHQGFFTEEALEQIAQTTFMNIDEFVAGKVLTNKVV